MPRYAAIALIFILLATLAGGSIYIAYTLQEQAVDTPDDTIRIVASIYPLAFFAEQVVQDLGDVTTLTPPGTEPHEYELTARDVARMQQADLVIINGGLEPWADTLETMLQDSRAPILIVSKGLATIPRENEKEASTSALDTHIWLDPILAKQAMLRITNAIKKSDPPRASTYTQNAQAFEKQFDALDTLYREGLAQCELNTIVPSHGAFSYLARRYGLTQRSIAGTSSEEEPSTRALADIATFVREHTIRYIFVEPLISPRLAETIATETGAAILELNPLEGLTLSDVQQGKDYFSIMRSNLHNLQIALACNT